MQPASDILVPQPSVPKPAIWHVFLWTVCVAIISAWNRESYGPALSTQSISIDQLVGAVTYHSLAGLAIAGFVLAVACAIGRRRYYPVTAGHWLFVAMGLTMIISEAHNAIADAWHRASPDVLQSTAHGQAVSYTHLTLPTILRV